MEITLRKKLPLREKTPAWQEHRHFCSVAGNRNNIRAFVSAGNSLKPSQFCNQFEFSNLRTVKVHPLSSNYYCIQVAISSPADLPGQKRKHLLSHLKLHAWWFWWWCYLIHSVISRIDSCFGIGLIDKKYLKLKDWALINTPGVCSKCISGCQQIMLFFYLCAN